MHHTIPSTHSKGAKICSSPQMTGALVPAQGGAPPEAQLMLTCTDVACGGSSRGRSSCRHQKTTLGLLGLAFPTLRCVNIYRAETTSQLRILELQRDDYSLLKLDFSSCKQIFLIWEGRRANYIKIWWKILVGTRHKNVLVVQMLQLSSFNKIEAHCVKTNTTQACSLFLWNVSLC